MAQQFGSSQAKGDYSAYSPSGNYQQYSQPSGYPQGGHMNYAQPAARSPQMTPDEIRAKYPDLERMPTVVDGPPGDPRRGSFNPNSPTWNDPRNAKARERFGRLLDEYTQYQNPQVNYAGGSQYPGGRGGQYGQTYYGTPEANYPGFPSGGRQLPAYQPPPAARPYIGTQESNYPGVPSGVQQQATAYQQPPQNYQQSQSFYMPTQSAANAMPDYSQRDAFIASINDSLGRQMSFGTPTPQPPQLNFPELWQQAGGMVRNGWSNPLAGLFS